MCSPVKCKVSLGHHRVQFNYIDRNLGGGGYIGLHSIETQIALMCYTVKLVSLLDEEFDSVVT